MNTFISRILSRARAAAADGLSTAPQTDRAAFMTTNDGKESAAATETADPPTGSAIEAQAPETAPAVEAEPGAADAVRTGADADADAENDSETAEEDAAEDADAASEPPAPDPERIAADAARIRALFAAAGDETSFRAARWTRPIRLAVYGAEPESAETIAAALAEAAAVAGATLADPEAEDGSEPNFLVYLCDDWAALAGAPGLRALEPELDAVLAGLAASDANQHAFFKASRSDGILLAVFLIRIDERLAAISGQAAALGQAARGLALWSDAALASENPIALRRSGRAAYKGWFARLLGALYAEGAPAYSEDPAYAEVLAEAIAVAGPTRSAGEAAPRDEGDGKRKRKRRRRRERGETGDGAKAEAGTETAAAEAGAGGAEPASGQEAGGAEAGGAEAGGEEARS